MLLLILDMTSKCLRLLAGALSLSSGNGNNSINNSNSLLYCVQMGGMSFLHYNMGIDEQVQEVKAVKQYQIRGWQRGVMPSVDKHGRCAALE